MLEPESIAESCALGLEPHGRVTHCTALVKSSLAQHSARGSASGHDISRQLWDISPVLMHAVRHVCVEVDKPREVGDPRPDRVPATPIYPRACAIHPGRDVVRSGLPVHAPATPAILFCGRREGLDIRRKVFASASSGSSTARKAFLFSDVREKEEEEQQQEEGTGWWTCS